MSQVKLTGTLSLPGAITFTPPENGQPIVTSARTYPEGVVNLTAVLSLPGAIAFEPAEPPAPQPYLPRPAPVFGLGLVLGVMTLPGFVPINPPPSAYDPCSDYTPSLANAADINLCRDIVGSDPGPRTSDCDDYMPPSAGAANINLCRTIV